MPRCTLHGSQISISLRSQKESYEEMKRIVLSSLTLLFVLSLGMWMGRASVQILPVLPSEAQIFSELQQMQEFRKIILRQEMARRIARDPAHRYGGGS